VSDHDVLTTRLAAAGFIAAVEESLELLDASKGDDDLLESLVERRLSGEPLAWITGSTTFCGIKVHVARGVYVPRWQSEPLVERAVSRLPERGMAVDLCTGSGAIAMALLSRRPDARVVASDCDERAVACSLANGIEVYLGDLFAPLPRGLEGFVDVIVGVVPYVPTRSMELLPRDTLRFESASSYDGGEEGTDVLRRVIRKSPDFLRIGGVLLLELGGDQAQLLEGELASHGFSNVAVLVDDDGDVRGIEATLERG
jgi:release factor glutamine methyltransferase